MGVDYTNSEYQDTGIIWGHLGGRATFIFSPQPIKYLDHRSISLIKFSFIKAAHIKF